MKHRTILFVLIFVQVLTALVLAREGFFAYYTTYGSREDITGPYADIVVNLGQNGQIIFDGESSYLPFFTSGNNKWYFEEIVERNGDGTEERPDKDNRYSYVRIIKNEPQEILIHWRYIPDFHNLNFSGVVHEYFYIHPDGRVSREIRKGDDDLVVFNDPLNRTIQKLQVTKKGIQQLSLQPACPSRSALPAIKGNPVITCESAARPALWMKFDEGLTTRSYTRKDSVYETFSGAPSIVKGDITLFKAGVSGSALAFDGYHSKVVIPREQMPKLEDGFTLETWLALDAYPWNWAAILDMHSAADLWFGVNDIGQPGFKYALGPDTLFLVSDDEIPLYQWTHVAVTVDMNSREATLFINGTRVKSAELVFDELEIPRCDAFVGLNRMPMRTTYHVSRDYPPFIRTPEGNQPMIFGLEGLIDEFKIYSQAVSAEQIRDIFTECRPPDRILKNPDLENRVLPGQVDGKNARSFGAVYSKLKYHDLWDNLWRTSDFPDVVVRFDQLPTSVVYWRGPNYGPGWVTENNIWMCDQSSEIYDYYGCSEHMADKQNRYSHVRIIENTPARVVIHWRYAANDITYALENRKTWSDEYHYIYPDGTAIRYVTWHDRDKPGWQDVQFFSPAGQAPEDQINLQALTVANLAGETYQMDWTDGIPENKLEDAVISVINFKSDYKVMVIYPQDQIDGIGAWGENERLDKSKTHFAGPWNHWPVSQMPNDGRYAVRNDRVTHSALGGGGPRDFALYGFTNKDIKELIALGRFFNNAPQIKVISGSSLAQFVQSEKAYHIMADKQQVAVRINATKDSPLVNPAFVLKNWNHKDAQIEINGKKVKPGKDLRIGYNYSDSGIDLIVWIQIKSEHPIEFGFTGVIKN